jgi:hypothetical protein
MKVYYIESKTTATVAWKRQWKEAVKKARNIRATESTGVRVVLFKVPRFTKQLVLALIEGRAAEVLVHDTEWQFDYDEAHAVAYNQAVN